MHVVQEAGRMRATRWPMIDLGGLAETARQRLRAASRTTPQRFRLARLVLVVGLVLVGSVAGIAVEAADRATRDIDVRIEPISAGSLTLYRSLAEADATLTSDFLNGSRESTQTRERYDDSIAEAARNLALTASRSGDDIATADRVGDIATALPVYTGLAEQAQAYNRQGLPAATASLQRASDLMRSAMLPTAEAVQARQAEELDETYAAAAAVPLPAIVLGVVMIAVLGAVQWYLFRRTNRMFNLGALVATGAVLLGALWWAVAGTAANGHLESSRTHIQSITDALGPGQVAAAQARAVESLALITREAGNDDDFAARVQLLARGDGAGGALGAARALASDPTGVANVETALNAVRDYAAAHDRVRGLVEAGQYDQAVESAVGADPSSSASAFAELDAALAAAVDFERVSFDDQIEQARSWRTGLTIGIAFLTVIAILGASLGINHRLKEYR